MQISMKHSTNIWVHASKVEEGDAKAEAVFKDRKKAAEGDQVEEDIHKVVAAGRVARGDDVAEEEEEEEEHRNRDVDEVAVADRTCPVAAAVAVQKGPVVVVVLVGSDDVYGSPFSETWC
ncbi:hypothetical protein L1049_003263 [Liquidambar formosana]|uniref:Uncharacterized protein n=1 Tax=Liquidambar formosana TaxID=63359 RepID=A0AAP0NMA4_LIQFO